MPTPVSIPLSQRSSLHAALALAAIVLMIGVTNMFNRLNTTTRQLAGAGG